MTIVLTTSKKIIIRQWFSPDKPTLDDWMDITCIKWKK